VSVAEYIQNLIGKHEGRHNSRDLSTWEANIKKAVEEVGCEVVD
jgi:hypothetical protein